MRLIRHGFNAVSCTEEPFRESVFFQIPLLLIRGKATEGFSAAIADEESTGNSIHNFTGVLITDGPIQGQPVDFPFGIADNTDLLLKGVIGFNVAAYGLLHGL